MADEGNRGQSGRLTTVVDLKEARRLVHSSGHTDSR